MTPRRPLLACALTLLISPALPLLAAPDGAPDVDFGGGDGIAHWTDGGNVTLHDVAATDALLIGVGSFEPTSGPPKRLHWQAVNDDGIVLTTEKCNETPSSLVPFAVETEGLAAIVDSSGNLLVGGTLTFVGTESQQRALLQRFDLSASSCALDTTFSTNGWDVEDDETWCDTEDCAVVALGEIRRETGADGAPRIVALVRSHVNFLVARYFLLGLALDGSIDSGFGTNGWVEVTTADLGPLGAGVDMTVDGQGQILVLVTRYDEGMLDEDTWLLRFSADGILDDSSWRIANSGPPATDDDNEQAQALCFDSSGILVTAHSSSADGSVALQELDLASGYLLDSTHSSTAWLSTALAAQGNGRYLEAHDLSAASDAIRLRRRLDGAAPTDYDPDFGSAGAVTIDVDLGGDFPQTLARVRLWHGRPVVGGTATTSGGHTAGFLARTINSYLFGATFEGGSFSEWERATIPHPVGP